MNQTADKIEIQTREFVKRGWQCPDCFGVRIETRRKSLADPRIEGFLCVECGCQFGSRA